MLIRARRLSSASTISHGESSVSMAVIISSRARE
jgi:hypothetical protein